MKRFWFRLCPCYELLVLKPTLLLILTIEEEEEEDDGGCTVMEVEILFQERNHSCMFVERSHCSSLASGLPLFLFFPKQNHCFSIQFRSLSLSLSIFVILLEISLSINWNCSWVLNVFPNYVINLWTFLAFCVTRLRKSNGFFSNWTEMNCWYLDLVVDQLGGPFFNLKF